MTPPERLRAELERLRGRGYTSTQAWPSAMSAALRGESASSAVFWRVAWREQRQLWATAYSRAPWPRNQRPTLDPVLLEEDRSEAARSATPVAA